MRKLGYWLADKLYNRGFLDGYIEEAKNESYDMGFEDGYEIAHVDGISKGLEMQARATVLAKTKRNL